jgi:hypothetical protein
MSTVSDAVLAMGALLKAVAEGRSNADRGVGTNEDGASIRQNY